MSPYKSLPEGGVRLLRLLPHSDENSRIECQLFTYPLLDSGGTHPYDALSYAWGPPEDNQQSVYVNGCVLPVRTNLYAALTHLRDRFIDRILWIDAICIDQGNDIEKGHQVEAMAKIYAKASRVIVWLGDAADNSNKALKAIRIAAEKQHQIPLIDETSHQAVIKLLERDWFQRIWVSYKQLAIWASVTNKAGSGPSGGCCCSTRSDQVWLHGN